MRKRVSESKGMPMRQAELRSAETVSGCPVIAVDGALSSMVANQMRSIDGRPVSTTSVLSVLLF